MNTTLKCIWCGILSAAFAVAAMSAETEQPPAKAVNAVCPVSGDPVDANAGTVDVKITHRGAERTVTVGTCCVDCQEKVRAKPEIYGSAAMANTKAENK